MKSNNNSQLSTLFKCKGLLGMMALMSMNVSAVAAPALTSSELKQEEGVVYTEEFSSEKIEFIVVKPGIIFSSKKGGRKLGILKLKTTCELIGFTDRAYKIRGTAEHGGASGWVTPRALASQDPKFVENLQKIHTRTTQIRALVANQEVAIGMTPGEVSASLGEPTKSKMRRDAQGESGTWEFINYEEVKHYQNIYNSQTRQAFRQVSHVTKEVKDSTKLEFEKGVVIAIEQSENKKSRPKIIPGPFAFTW